jgi:hypothetical protein
LAHIDKVDPGLRSAALRVGPLPEQKKDKDGQSRQFFRHGDVRSRRNERGERKILDADVADGQRKSV